MPAKKKRTARRNGTKRAAKKPAATHRNGARAAASEPLLESLRNYVRSAGLGYLDDPNVTSIGVGRRADGTPVVQFTVGKKVEPEQIEELGSKELPKTIDVDGVVVPTEVIERSYRPAYQLMTPRAKDPRKLRRDRLQPGISVSHPDGTAGTLGAVVYDAQTGAPCMLSNWHVLHGDGGQLGDTVVQPGPFDDDRIAQNAAGVLLRSHLGPAGDCAIARIENRTCSPEVYGLRVRIARLGRPELGDLVIKSGRTTGVTTGIVRRVDVTAKLHYGEAGTRRIGGFEIGPPEGASATYEVSMGGDSGSAWLIGKKGRAGKVTATDIMVGLHFAGETGSATDEHALACYAHAVFEKLEVAFEPPAVPRTAVEAAPAGYDPHFLIDGAVEPPKLAAFKANDVVRIHNQPLIPYTHFSVCQSRARRLAHFVAWMIDGERLRKESRRGLKFMRDPRIDEIDPDAQIGDELYADNDLDRGHIARRADLIWGPRAEARRANRDSFYFPNIHPQHARFNQSARGGLWGELEDAIFEEVEVLRQRLVLFGGPIFADDDPVYRDIRIPRSFWKVIAYIDAEDGQLEAKAFVLTQADLIRDLEAFDLDPYRIYQMALSELETRAGLGFGKLKPHDTFVKIGPESLASKNAVREIQSFDDIVR